MSFQHDLTIENGEELVLKPDTRPTISCDDDEHYPIAPRSSLDE